MSKVWVDQNTIIEIEHAEGINAVHLIVDDKPLAVSGGQTILEAVARIPGIDEIPTLCYHPDITSYGACRLCTVEVSEDGGKNYRFVAACLFDVKEGLIVKTNSEKVRKLRRGIIELLLSRAPNVKRLQELAQEYGVERPRFVFGDQGCILCGLCVRACQEIIGRSAISLVNRGIYREVSAPFYAYGVSSECIGCGDCAYVCPTGAIKLGADGKAVLPRVKIPLAEMELLKAGSKE